MTAGRQNLLLLGVSFALALLLAEVGLRAAGISYPQVYVMDPVRGSALRPGAEGWYRSEGHAYFKINSDGLRDREHSLAKRANAIRIAVLGDSVVEAMQVEEDRNVSRVLDRKLSECEALGGKQVEVINFGSTGWCSTHRFDGHTDPAGWPTRCASCGMVWSRVRVWRSCSTRRAVTGGRVAKMGWPRAAMAPSPEWTITCSLRRSHQTGRRRGGSRKGC